LVGSRDFNKLVIKAKMHAKTPLFLMKIQYDIFIFIFERLGRMHENKIYYFLCFAENRVF